MILRFLRLFSWFRSIEADSNALKSMIDGTAALLKERDELRDALQQETSRALILQDRLDAAEQERQRLWEELRTSLAGERTAYQMQVNAAWMKDYGVAPHVDAPAPPMKPKFETPENPTISRRLTPSESTAMLTRQFINSQIKPGE